MRLNAVANPEEPWFHIWHAAVSSSEVPGGSPATDGRISFSPMIWMLADEYRSTPSSVSAAPVSANVPVRDEGAFTPSLIPAFTDPTATPWRCVPTAASSENSPNENAIASVQNEESSVSQARVESDLVDCTAVRIIQRFFFQYAR